MMQRKFNFTGDNLNIYSVLTAFFTPFLVQLALSIPVSFYYGKDEIDPYTTLIVPAIAGFVSLLILFFYTNMLPSETKLAVLGECTVSKAKSVSDFFSGVLLWLIAYPAVIAASLLSRLILKYLYAGPFYEQVAVLELKRAGENFLLLIFMIVNVAILVPILEELLFRGFLQPWLTQTVSRRAAIGLTSILFGLVHLSEKQGINNVEIFFALFILSLFLGYIREKRNSILAPIGLHMAFNGVSSVMIITNSW